ncbi:MAG: hypothetical protein BWY87_00721 [Deltaproteobacteria bacterium ADurb.Bin510]|nr:MAG: hypothetical protein BWY87_00721 [Deltaproteobacteria bacterium ADurb.Bin510]
MMMYGMVLPNISSIGSSGVTISCSMVPDSRSRIMAIEVSSSESSMTTNPTMPGTKKYWL